MINKTYPSRHRLISKDREGTNLNGKPYIGRWDAVLSSLGLSLTGTILFASHVLLTEGDSDPIYLYAVLQKAIRTGERSIQLNPLSIMGTSDSRNTDVIIRFLLESNPAPRIALIFDGDKGGTDRSAYLQALIKDNELPEKILTKDTTLEDHLPMIREAFIPAVADYAAKLSGASGETLLERLQEAYEAEYQQKVTKNLAKWARETARDIAELPSPPSKVGVAREYAIRLADIGDFKLDTRSAALVDWIVDNLKLPTQGHIDQAVLRA